MWHSSSWESKLQSNPIASEKMLKMCKWQSENLGNVDKMGFYDEETKLRWKNQKKIEKNILFPSGHVGAANIR